jgi:hypothetical protein
MSMKVKEQPTTNVCYVQKITHNKYLPKIFLFSIRTLVTIIIIFVSSIYLPRRICIYISGQNRGGLHRRKISSKIVALSGLSFLASITITVTVFPPLDYVQVPLAHAQQETNNNSNNTKFASLSTISTIIGTGAAATGAIVTVPCVMKTRKQSKFLATYLLKIRNKYDELCRNTKTKPTYKSNYEFLDFLDALRSEIIYLLQNGDINENQYKMLDDRITEYLGRIKAPKVQLAVDIKFVESKNFDCHN